MRFGRPDRRTILACLSALIGLAGAGPAPAQKKGGGTTPPSPAPGTVYFQSNGPKSMNGDGSGRATSIDGQPSYGLHGGSRWFLQARTVDDFSPERWFAANAAGASVQLTFDSAVRRTGYPAVWAKDDSFFSFTALEETADEWIGRLVVVPIDWSGGTPTPGTPTAVYEIRRPLWDEPIPGVPTSGIDEAELSFHDWSPAGDAVAQTRWVWGEGWVIDVLTFSESGLTSRRLAKGDNPAWSPDGGRVAYNRRGTVQTSGGYFDVFEVWTVRADGADPLRLTTFVASGKSATAQISPTWSPDGAFLAYTERVITSSKWTANIRRIPSSGGPSVSLTSDGVSTYPRWRP
jgi:hypothetical protein